jgi:peptidoglycan/LPS O-acetylase OafA/YrhL
MKKTNIGLALIRAAAVILVVGFHAEILYMGGGFIGVDIFFLLSGFLIASSLTHSMEHGKFNWKRFYNKRIRKIVPSLIFTVVSIISVFYYFSVLNENFYIFVRHGVLSILGISNFEYMISGTQETMFSYSPFLHLWSLAVEIQFYILAPLIYILIMKYKKLDTVKVLLTVIIVSLFVFIFSSIYDITFGYYFSLGRVWEFALGALIFVLLQKDYQKWGNLFSEKQLKFLTYLSVLTIIVFTTGVGSFIPYSPTWSFFPVAAATILIYVSSIVNMKPNKLFNIPISISKISYSLYLVHYPIMFIINIYYPEIFWVSIIVSVLAAYLIYNMVEKRFIIK